MTAAWGGACIHVGSALLLCGACWLTLRRVVSAPLRGVPTSLLLLDAAPVAALWLSLTGLTGRPVWSAVVICMLTALLIGGNQAKRATSGEPLVFSDISLLPIVAYPSLYAAFASPWLIIAAIGMAGAVLGILLLAEPPVWHFHLAWLFGAVIVSIALMKSSHVAARFGRPPVDPASNLAMFGPVAGTILHAVIASRERQGRQRPAAPGHAMALPAVAGAQGPIILLQLESFFDARRLGPFVRPDLLPHFDRCARASVRFGRLRIPAYGANTVRTEFAALTGMAERDLGFDRFNPYAAFARVPIDSIAWRLKALGYRTVCIHPFDGRFYRRDAVLPNLGFDDFLDARSFTATPHPGGYISDHALVRKIAGVLEEFGPRTFIFAISMGNHGPWRHAGADADTDPDLSALHGFLDGLRDTDRALGELTSLLQHNWRHAVLAAYGDHQPCFPRLYQRLGHADRATDYLLWRPARGAGHRVDMDVRGLSSMLLNEAARLHTPVPRLRRAG